MMKINKLIASNFMRLNVEVEMDGADVIITGKNEVGKSTFINAFWYALTGKDIPDEPIQQGKDSGKLEVTISRPNDVDLIVTRTFKRDGKDTLSVKTPEGAKFGSPQQFLNQLIGEISFDPFEFIAKQPLKQKQELQKLLGIDTTELERKKVLLLSERLAKENLLKTKQAELENIPDHGATPLVLREMSEVSVKQNQINDVVRTKNEMQTFISKLMTDYNNGQQHIESKQSMIKTNIATIDGYEKKIQELNELIKFTKNTNTQLDSQIADLQTEGIKLNAEIEHKNIEFNQIVVPDGSGLEKIIDEINVHNRRVGEQVLRTQYMNHIMEIEEQITAKNEEVKAVEYKRIALIKSAKMPVNGLDFTDDGLLFDGLPFVKDQFSTAKMNMIGFQIAVAMNPKLRILKVKDWVLMDSVTKEQLTKLAHDNGFQMFIEQVSDDKDIGFIIQEPVTVAAA